MKTVSREHYTNWGCALSGGAAWGIANAGIISVFEEQRWKPRAIAGSSMGAIVGGLWALGIESSAIRTLCEEIQLRNVARLSKRPFKDGLQSGLLRHEVERHLHPLIADARIGDCQIPFYCTAARIKNPIHWRGVLKAGFVDQVLASTELTVFLPQTRLMDAILASSAIPVLFEPVVIDRQQYCDLCNFGAVPTHTLREIAKPDIVIATDTMPRFGPIKKWLPTGWRELYEAGDQSLEESLKAADLIIKPEFRHSCWRFDKSVEFFEAGKSAGEQSLQKMRSFLE